ncbi:glycosyltransferase, partial [Gemmatimonas sp.]|uniref:glycosyltransferase n=1 Tax=Gemmatimonas sp. TaxID=1962908 RepID=UPI00333E7846
MRRAPRVLFVTHNVPRFDGDAAGSFVLRLAVGLQALGARIQVIAPGAAGLPALSSLEGVQVERVRYASDDRMTLAYTGNMAETVRASWSGRFALLQLLLATRRAVSRAVTGAIRDGDPFDIVHIHWWFPSGLALWKLFGRGDPARVVTMHGSDVRLAANTNAAHPVMRAVLTDAAACTAVS